MHQNKDYSLNIGNAILEPKSNEKSKFFNKDLENIYDIDNIYDKEIIYSKENVYNTKNIRFKYVKKTVTSSQFDLSQGDLSRDLSLNLQEENLEKASLNLGTKILI